MKSLLNKIHCAECLDFLRGMPEGAVDLVLTDPPYFRVVADKWDRQWASLADFQKWCGEVGREMRRVLKPSGALVWFGDDKSIAYVQTELDKYFSLVNSCVWKKPSVAGSKGILHNRCFTSCSERFLYYEQKSAIGAPATGLVAIHSSSECFASVKAYLRSELRAFMAARGLATAKDAERLLTQTLGHTAHKHYFCDSQFALPSAENYARLQSLGYWSRAYEDLRAEYDAQRAEYEAGRRAWSPHRDALDVLEFAVCPGELHPTQKPLPLWCYLLERAARPGGVVLDPFSGSGTTAIACHKLGLDFVCCERDAGYWRASCERLAKEREQGQLALFAAPPMRQGDLFG